MYYRRILLRLCPSELASCPGVSPRITILAENHHLPPTPIRLHPSNNLRQITQIQDLIITAVQGPSVLVDGERA
jgi:hypothetical protein